MPFILVVLSILFSLPASAGCRDQRVDATVPECPPNGSPLLNEGYPIKATFISDRPYQAELTDTYIDSVLEAQAENPPQIFFITTPARASAIRDRIAKRAPPELKEKWLSSLSPVMGEHFTWLQDLMQSRTDLRSGQTSLSYIQPMERLFKSTAPMVRETFAKLKDAASKNCDINAGEILAAPNNGKDFSDPFQNPSGFGGGNLEGGPAGICIVGSNHLSEKSHSLYAKKVCGKGPILKPPTSWLHVGHADEIGITVRSGPGPCDEAYLITSPRRALELLKANPNEPAFPELADTISASHLGQKIGYDECFVFHDLKNDALPAPEPARSNTWLQLFKPVGVAHAEYKSKSKKGLTSADMVECRNMTNRELSQVFEFMHGPAIHKIQKDLDIFEADLKKLWKAQRPECEPKVIAVPTLYRNRSWAIDQKERVVTRGFPLKLSPVNGQQVNKTVLMPDPQNKSFQKDIDDQLKALNLKSRYFDTSRAAWDGGNLHCLTNSVRYCRPRSAK